MKIGDLVCYNAAGQKHKTLGMVIDLSPKISLYNIQDSALVQWLIIGDFMPRRTSVPGKPTTRDAWHRGEIESGEMVWHEIGNWIEVTK